MINGSLADISLIFNVAPPPGPNAVVEKLKCDAIRPQLAGELKKRATMSLAF